MTARLLALVVHALEAAGIRFALVGAGALAVHGVARSTFDVDLLVTDRSALDPRIWQALSAGGQVGIDIRRGDLDDPLAGVVRLTMAGERDVDVVVGRDGWQKEAIERANAVDVGRLSIPVVGAADLVLLKLFAGGVQDLWDIEQLLVQTDAADVSANVRLRLPQLPDEARRAWERLTRR